MRRTLLPATLWIALLLVVGCSSLFKPKQGYYEQEILKFHVQNVKIGSAPSALKVFAQVKKQPQKQDNMDVYQVFNPNPHISTLIAWYFEEKLHKMELRYFEAASVNTLKISGGLDGLAQDLVKFFGPPSEFGPQVPLATSMQIDPSKSKYNNVWFFSRVNRQLNFVGETDGQSGVAVITLQDTTPLKEKKSKKKAKDSTPIPPTPPPADKPGPGFSVN